MLCLKNGWSKKIRTINLGQKESGSSTILDQKILGPSLLRESKKCLVKKSGLKIILGMEIFWDWKNLG